jgi:hypothetical protein
MRRNQLFGLFAVTAFALCVSGGIAIAQSPPPPAPAPVVDANIGIAREVKLSPQDQVIQADGFLNRMDGMRGAMRRQLETSRANRDVVKTLCLNDKLNQMDVAIRSAHERKQALDAAVARRDNDLAGHEFTILSVLNQRSQQLTAEANQCIGNEAFDFPPSQVTETIDSNLPDEDPTQFPNNVVIVQPPACGSCFK